MAGFARPDQGRSVSFLHFCGEGESVKRAVLHLQRCDDSPRLKPGASQQTEVSRRLRPSQYVFALLNGKVALKLLKDLTERAQEHLYASAFTQGNDLPCNAQTLFGCVCTKTLVLVYQVGVNMSMLIYPPLPYPPQKDSLLSLGLKSRVLRSI